MQTERRRENVPAAVMVLTCAVLCGLVLAGTPAPAIGDGGGGGDETRRAAGKPADPDYTAGVKAIKAGDYPTAIRSMEAVVARDPKDADAYSWLAYATRKGGDPAKSIPIYEKALALDPKHRGAHEYIGEAYLALNNLAKAKEHLAKLDSLCFFTCSEYRDLKKAVQAYEANGGKTPATGR